MNQNETHSLIDTQPATNGDIPNLNSVLIHSICYDNGTKMLIIWPFSEPRKRTIPLIKLCVCDAARKAAARIRFGAALDEMKNVFQG